MRSWFLREELPSFSGQGSRERLQGTLLVLGETRDILEFTLQQRPHAGWILWGRTIVTGLAGGFSSYFQACSVEPERL